MKDYILRKIKYKKGCGTYKIHTTKSDGCSVQCYKFCWNITKLYTKFKIKVSMLYKIYAYVLPILRSCNYAKWNVITSEAVRWNFMYVSCRW